MLNQWKFLKLEMLLCMFENYVKFILLIDWVDREIDEKGVFS